jgi:predicted TIM-barrel fold metal-dependent hydrolase
VPGSDWIVEEQDRELFRRELDSFVPPRIFDAHAHLYETSHFTGDAPQLVLTGPACADYATYRARMDEIHPGRSSEGLFFGFPATGVDFEKTNLFLTGEARRHPGSRALMLVHPGMDPEFIRETVRREGFAGLKCYHVFASEQPTFQAAIPSYLPEEQVRIAHEGGLVIMLHMVRSRALADPVNQQDIRRYCTRYPNMKLILAHAARGFNPHHTIEGIESMRGLGNVWCDTSAVTEAGACEAILRVLGPGRLLYGADFPVSHLRGRCVAIGDSFLWLSADNVQWEAGYGDVRPSLVGLESLRVLKLACRHARLTDSQVEGVFRTNAVRLLGIEP